MKKTLTLFLSIIMIIALCMGVAGCKLEEGAPDADKAVATVGTEKVTVGELQDLIKMYADFYKNYYNYDIYSSATEFAEFKRSLLDSLIDEKLMLIKADELGVSNLSAEDQAELDAMTEENVNEVVDEAKAQAEAEHETDSTINVEIRTKEIVESMAFEYTGESLKYDDYIQQIKDDTKSVYLSEKLYNFVVKDVAVMDEDIQKEYDAALAEDKELYAETPADFETNQGEADKNPDAYPAVFVPEGYSRILHINAANSAALPAEYTEKETRCAAIKTEYSELAFADALSGKNDNKTKRGELIAEYKTLKTEMETIATEHMAEAKKKIDDAYAALEDGKSFLEVMKLYNDDKDFTDYPTLEIGKLISKLHKSSAWTEETYTAFSELEVGKYSEAYLDSKGYHIIYYVSDVAPGEVPLDKVKEIFKAGALSNKQGTEYELLLTEWHESDLVKIDEKVLESIA